jgi:hypothetical protein
VRTATATLFREYDGPVSQHPGSGGSSTESKDLREQSLQARLASASISSIAGEQKWIPNAAIEELVTVESVTTALERLYGHNRAFELANEVVNGGYRKLFAILVLIGKEASLLSFVLESIQDSVLPLMLEDSSAGCFLVLRNTGSPISSFSEWDEEDLKRFNSTQWSVFTPYFTFPDAGSDILQHFEIDQDCLLPFTNDNSSTSSKTGFGRVHKVQIQESIDTDQRVCRKFHRLELH